eukprot:TRINITY_DN5764_c0_g1_i4.p1 TRINITY_DN5764_c0_g1~~TRINITY_DN5764_c0_g1_i4.p1  ORF type:complete len:200 (+),score=24.62 TRINITY_DN5764_c0_g1_i4:34-633(+)
MCLLPLGGFNSYLIPPSEKASKLADYLKVVIMMHFALAICLFLSLMWVFFWGCIKMIMYFSGVQSSDAPSVSWEFYVYVGTLISGPLIYILACVIGYYLYKELKLTWTNTAMQANMMQGGGFGGMWGAPQTAPQTASGQSDYYGGSTYGRGPSSSVSTSAPPPPPVGGFKAFAGQGHTLEIGRAVQQECRDRSRMPSSA